MSDRCFAYICSIFVAETFALSDPKIPKSKFCCSFANSHDSLDQIAKHDADFGFIEKPLETSGVQRGFL